MSARDKQRERLGFRRRFLSARHDSRTLPVVGRQDPVVQNRVRPRRRHERTQPGQEGVRGHLGELAPKRLGFLKPQVVGHAWFHTREADGVRNVETSSDGAAFVPFHQIQVPFGIAVATVGVAGPNWDPSGAAVYVFAKQFEFHCAD